MYIFSFIIKKKKTFPRQNLFLLLSLCCKLSFSFFAVSLSLAKLAQCFYNADIKMRRGNEVTINYEKKKLFYMMKLYTHTCTIVGGAMILLKFISMLFANIYVLMYTLNIPAV